MLLPSYMEKRARFCLFKSAPPPTISTVYLNLYPAPNYNYCLFEYVPKPLCKKIQTIYSPAKFSKVFHDPHTSYHLYPGGNS